jgi:hypothetical protein
MNEKHTTSPQQAPPGQKPAEALSRALQQLIETAHQNSTQDMADQNIPMLYQMSQMENQQQQNLYQLEAIKKQLDTLTANHKLLENAGRSNELLGQQHYQQHVLDPLLRSVFPVFDLINDAATSKEDGSTQLHATLDTVWSQLEQFLAAYDVHIIRHLQGQDFAPKIMKPVKWVSTPEKKLDHRVCQCLQIGFRRGQEQILRHETVSLYQYEAEKSTNLTQIERIEQ